MMLNVSHRPLGLCEGLESARVASSWELLHFVQVKHLLNFSKVDSKDAIQKNATRLISLSLYRAWYHK